jgi:hypothetical protein
MNISKVNRSCVQEQLMHHASITSYIVCPGPPDLHAYKSIPTSATNTAAPPSAMITITIRGACYLCIGQPDVPCL